jgi:hypothetical protein
MSGLARSLAIGRRSEKCPQAEVKWHAITSTMLNDIVQSVVDAVSNYCHGASGTSGLPAIRKPFELNELRRQRRNEVAVNSLARIPDRFS